MKRGVSEFGLGLVCMCVAMYASGCVFAPSFGEVSPEDSTALDMSTVMTDGGQADMKPPGPDMPPPPDDMGMPFDAGMICDSESDCVDGVTTCILGRCELCMDQPVVSDECHPAPDIFLCGRGSMGGNCAIDCMCPDESFVCEPAASNERGTCVPPKGDVCLGEEGINTLCDKGQTCRAVQYMCPIQGLQTSECDGMREGSVCTAAVKPTPGMALSGRRVAMGSRHAVVSHGTEDPPDFYFKNASGDWVSVTGLSLELDQNKTVDALALLFGADVDGESLEITTHGVAVDISEDDSYMAVTTGIKVTLKGSNDGQALNIVNVFRRGMMGWRLEGVVTPLMGEASSRFGESIALHGNLLLVGAPQANESRGAIRLYDLNAMDGSTPSSFQLEMSCESSIPGAGSQVDFGRVGMEPVLYTVAEVGPDMYQAIACSRSVEFTGFGPEVSGSAQNLALSASNSNVFIRSAEQAAVYSMTTDMVTISGRKAAQYDSLTLTSGGPLLARLVQDMNGMGRQVLMNSADTVHVAPPGHTTMDGVDFDAYDSYFPIASSSSAERTIVAADLNSSGDVIMLVQRGQQAAVFFAQVQASL